MKDLSDIISYKILLASKSPRRLSLLQEMGLDIEVISLDVEEGHPQDLEYSKIPEYLAIKKSKAFNTSNLEDNHILLSADTMVFLEGRALSKPKDRQDAIRSLAQLSSTTHEVITGVCLRTKSKHISFSSTTKVEFTSLSQEEIEYYVDKFKPYDKAGGYAIQEWIGMVGISKISGSYYNVVGLPTDMVYKKLKEIIA